MSTNSDHHSARKSPSVRPRALWHLSLLSLCIAQNCLAVTFVLGGGRECRIVAEQAYEQITTNNRRITLWDRCGIAVGLLAVLMRAMVRLRGRR